MWSLASGLGRLPGARGNGLDAQHACQDGCKGLQHGILAAGRVHDPSHGVSRPILVVVAVAECCVSAVQRRRLARGTNNARPGMRHVRKAIR